MTINNIENLESGASVRGKLNNVISEVNSLGTLATQNSNNVTITGGSITGTAITGNLTGNASTATALQTARTLTLGSTGKTFNGTANVSWSLSEIGVGTLGQQNSNNATIIGGTINGTSIGATTASTGAFTSITGTAVTQSTTDTTSGRLMKVGDFGLGQTGSVPIMPDLNDTDFPSGIFRYQPSALNRPDGSGAGIVLNLSYSVIDKAQLAVRHFAGSSRGTIYSRAYHDNEWTPWRESYDTLNILGTVSQSGGVPTGAIIQRGSNSNGEFVRYADGTQICFSSVNCGSAVSSGSGQWEDAYRTSFVSPSFSAQFISAPIVSIVATAPDAPFTQRHSVIGYNFVSSTIVSGLRVIRIGDGTSTADVIANIIAIGRWF